jgi:hypothetical protein
MSSSHRRAGPEARAWAGVALLLLLALGVVGERARWFARLSGAAGVERAWIWSDDPPRKVEPSAFFVARDVEIDAFTDAARLELLADPEYVVYVNGKRVGSGRAAAANEIDVYPVAPRLRRGWNRIVIELRSPTGSGAVTLRLDDGRGRTVLAADPDWLVYRTLWRGLLAGEPFIEAAKVKLLATSPFGRWSAARLGIARPRFDQVVAGRALAPLAWRRAGERQWREISRVGKEGRRPGGSVEVDFGREVAGYLRLSFDRKSAARGLLRFGTELAESPGWNPDAIVLTSPNRGSWQDAEPRRFRYVELVGLDQLDGVALLPMTDAGYARLATPPAAALLSSIVRPVRLPVVDEIWRRYGMPFRSGAQAPPAPVPAGRELRRDVAARTPAPAPGHSGRRRPATRRARRERARPTP